MLGRVYPESTGGSGNVIGGVVHCNKGGCRTVAWYIAGAASGGVCDKSASTAWRGRLLPWDFLAGSFSSC